jgi:hypothetical protein
MAGLPNAFDFHFVRMIKNRFVNRFLEVDVLIIVDKNRNAVNDSIFEIEFLFFIFIIHISTKQDLFRSQKLCQERYCVFRLADRTRQWAFSRIDPLLETGHVNRDTAFAEAAQVFGESLLFVVAEANVAARRGRGHR